MNNIKKNDVFHCRYTEEYNKIHSYTNHCFEGLVVAIQTSTGLMLADTYWGVGDTSGKCFKLSDVGEKINIEFYCNLDEIEKSLKGSSTKLYYEEEDYFVLTRQHGCSENCKQYFIKKEAKISKEKLIASIEGKIEEENRIIRSANYYIGSLKKDLEKVNNNELENIYI